MTQIITSRGGGGGGGGASYTAGCGIDIQNNEISIDTSVVQTTGNMVCDLTGADNDHYPSALAVANAISCSGGGDVMGPSCSTDGNVVLFDGATGKCIKDSGVSLSCKQDKLTAGANIDMTCAKVSATNTYIVTEAITCTTYTGEKGVAPYNTSYCYTNICIDPASGIKWQEGSIYTFDIDTEMLATSACRNVRVKIGDGDYIPVMGTSSILAGNSYFTKTNIRQYQYSTKYQACGALHLFTDSNTTYSDMTNTEATTGTCTSGRSIAACTLKCAINYYAPISGSAYGSGWDSSTSAPTQNAVYDKIEAVVSSIPTVNNATLTIQKNGTTVNTFTANASSNVTANITVPTCVSQLSNDSGFITGISCGDVTTALGYTPYNSSNPSGYTTCTGTVSTCADVIGALGYTPYNSTNPNGYTTCTGTLVAGDLTVVSGDTGCVYTIKKSTTAPSGAGSNTITLVVE